MQQYHADLILSAWCGWWYSPDVTWKTIAVKAFSEKLEPSCETTKRRPSARHSPDTQMSTAVCPPTTVYRTTRVDRVCRSLCHKAHRAQVDLASPSVHRMAFGIVLEIISNQIQKQREEEDLLQGASLPTSKNVFTKVFYSTVFLRVPQRHILSSRLDMSPDVCVYQKVWLQAPLECLGFSSIRWRSVLSPWSTTCINIVHIVKIVILAMLKIASSSDGWGARRTGNGAEIKRE